MGDIYTNPPQSRNEAILRATIDSTEYTDPPQSRIEDLLLELKEAIEEGGGGGTSVVPNPESEATAELEKVKIGTTTYSVLEGLGTAAKKDSTNAVTEDSRDLVESGAVYSALNSKQPKTLSTPITIGGVSRTTVEAALGALEDSKEDTILAASPLVKEYDEVMRQDVLRLTMDDTPTASSNNPVKSGGVKSAVTATVDLLKDTTGWLGGNKCPYPYFDKGNKTDAGINFIDNGDGTITVKAGTSTGNANYYIAGNATTNYANVTDLEGMMIIGNPTNYIDSNVDLRVWFYDKNKTYIGGIHISNSGTVINIPSNAVYYVLVIRVDNGLTVPSDVLISPMIITPEQYALNPTYRPYHESIEEIIDTVNENLKYRNVRLQDVPNEGSIYDKVVNVAEQLDALVTDIGVKFSGYVLWTQSMFLRVEAIRCNATTLLYTIFNASYTIYNGAVQNGAVTVYKFEGTLMTA